MIKVCYHCEYIRRDGSMRNPVVCASCPPKVRCELTGTFKDLGDVCDKFEPEDNTQFEKLDKF